MRMKILKKTIDLLFTILIFGIVINTAYAHTAQITISGDNRYKAVRLTPQVYNAANGNLSDILIKDAGSENTPYFINSGVKNATESRESYPLVLINSYLKDDNFYFDYKLAAERGADTISTSVEFSTQYTNFAKEVDVYGSYDNINWDYVQNDIIYSIDDKTKLTIEFTRPQKFTHYRLKLANNLEQIAFDTATLVYVVEIGEENYFIETIEPGFNVESANKETYIDIKGLKNLRLCDITIHSDSMFSRYANAPGGVYKELYNLSLNGATYADTTLQLNWHISADDAYRITIADADDKPIQVDGVTVRYYADDIVFEGRADGTYTLEFDGGAAGAAPVYDIARYKTEILKGPVDRVTIGEIVYAEIKEPAQERDYRMIFNIVIVVVTLLLGSIIVIKLKKK